MAPFGHGHMDRRHGASLRLRVSVPAGTLQMTPPEEKIGGRGSLKQRGFRVSFPLLAVGAAVLLSGCGATKQSALAPVGPVARAQLGMFWESLAIMTGIFVIVAAVFLYSLIRFRARKGDATLPKQVHGNTTLEIAWTIIPIILLVFLAIPTVHYAYAFGDTPPNAMKVDVVGHQFWWEFDYPGSQVTTANVVHIPVNTKVDFVLTSADVIHSFWVPRLGGKTDLIPGRVNHLWLESNQTGTFYGQCAQLCGAGHAYMKFSVVVQSQAAYAAWVQSMQHPKVSVTTPAQEAGMQLFSQDCATCHTIGGTTFNGKIGPNLTALMTRPTIAAGTLTNTPANLAKWLHDPPGVKPGALMPNLHLSQTQIQSLVAFLETLK